MLEVVQGNVNPTGVAGVQTHGAYLRFSHPHIDEDLVVSSGANSIKWMYTLNTNQQSTIGGEVIQVLGTYVGPLVIEGMASSVAELVKIKSWFVQVFERMGTVYKSGGNISQYRDETAVKFEYPARGWQFLIQPTKLRGFKYDKTVFAPPWQIEAEIVTDNAMDFLNAATFSAFTGPLMNPIFYDTGYSDPTGHGKASRFVNPQWSGSIAGLGSTMGDNFQRLVEQYVGGGFGDFAYNSLLPYAHPGKAVSDEYNALFGTPGIQTVGGGSGSGSQNAASGSGTAGAGGSNATFTDTSSIQGDPGINGKIVQAAAAAGVSPVLALAVAQNESSSNPDAYNGITAVGAFQFYIKTAPHDTEGKAAQAALRAAGLSPGHGSGTSALVTQNYPFDHQLEDFLTWTAAAKPSWLAGKDVFNLSNNEIAQWAELAQVSGTYCTPNSTNGGVSSSSTITGSFLPHVQAARGAIQTTSGSATTIPASGNAVATAKALLTQYGKKWFDDSGTGLAQIKTVAAGQKLSGPGGPVDLDYRTMDTLLRLIGAGYTVGTFAWCTDHAFDSMDGHAGGKAVDISSLNGVAINQEAAGAYTRAAGVWIKNNIVPRQLITAGFGGHQDAQCLANCLPNASFYVYPDSSIATSKTLNQHTNHIHVGF